MTPSATAEASRIRRDRAVLFLEVLALAGVYFLSGKLGLKLAARVHDSVTAVWPPTGIALAACLLVGLRVWPGIFLGALLVNLATSGSWIASSGIAAGNTLEAVIGCWLVNRFAGGKHAFDRPRDVFRFALLAAVASTAVSATVGVSTLWLTGPPPEAKLGSIWLTWWLGDLGGDLVIAPFLIVWGSKVHTSWSSRRLLEGASLLAILFLMTWTVFGGRLVVSTRNYAIDFLCIPAVLWASFRFGPRGTAAAILLLSSVALWGTLRQFGPFPRMAQNESLLLLQAFLGVTSVTAFAVAAAVEEWRRASEDLARKLEEVARLNRRLDEQREEISTYHSLLSHDISNFSMALLNLLDRLLFQADGTLTGKQMDLLRRSNRQALEMHRMAENARMLAGVRERGLPASEERLRIREALDRTVHLVRDLHFDRVFEIAIDCAGQIEAAGPPLLESVLVNLLDNAVRHGPRTGRPLIGVRVACEGKRLAIAIRGGTPPAPDRLRALFEKEIPKERSSAHGIGLILVREIIERAGGTLSATTSADGDLEAVEVSLALPEAGVVRNPGQDRPVGAPEGHSTLTGNGEPENAGRSSSLRRDGA